jgi:hypothetical protein
VLNKKKKMPALLRLLTVNSMLIVSAEEELAVYVSSPLSLRSLHRLHLSLASLFRYLIIGPVS